MMIRRVMLAITALLGLCQGAWAQVFTETFNNVAGLSGSGWLFVNNSNNPNPVGAWQQGSAGSSLNNNGGPPSPPDGSFAVSTFLATADAVGTLNDWMLTPAFTFNNGDTINFFTRTNTGNVFPERLQIRIATSGDLNNVGSTSTDVGSYTTLLLDINPTYTSGNPGGYPDTWATGNFNIILSGLTGPTTTRVAFRHFVESSGNSGANGDNLGIDSLTITTAVPEPMTMALIGTAVLAGAYGYRRQHKARAKALETSVE